MNTRYNYFYNSLKGNFINRRLSSKSSSSLPQSSGVPRIPQEQKRRAPEVKRTKEKSASKPDVQGKIKEAKRDVEDAQATLRKLQRAARRKEHREHLAPIQQKELTYFLKAKRNPKERYLLYNMLKYGIGRSNIQVEQNWTIYKLRSQFTRPLSKHTGFYYKGNKLVVVGGMSREFAELKNYNFLTFHSNPIKLERSGIVSFSRYHTKDSSPGSPAHMKREMTRYLKRFKDYQSDSMDGTEIRRHMSKRGVNAYVMYRFLEGYGIEVDHNWTKQEIFDNFVASGAFRRYYNGKPRAIRLQKFNRDALIGKALREYYKYKGGGARITDAYVVKFRDYILSMSKRFDG